MVLFDANELCWSRTQDCVKSHGEECYKIRIWVVQVICRAGFVWLCFVSSSSLVFKAVQLQKISRHQSHNCSCVGILSKLQISTVTGISVSCRSQFLLYFLLVCLCGLLHCFKYLLVCIFFFLSKLFSLPLGMQLMLRESSVWCLKMELFTLCIEITLVLTEVYSPKQFFIVRN